jgi:hypothetical protein
MMVVYIMLVPPLQPNGDDIMANFQAVAFPAGGGFMQVAVQLRVVPGASQTVEREAILAAVNAAAQRIYGGTIPVGATIRWFGV